MASNYRPPVAICCPGIKFSKTNFWVDSKIYSKYKKCYSSYSKLLLNVTQLIKLIRNWVLKKQKSKRIERNLIITDDIKQSESLLISTAQIESYTEEHKVLLDKRKLPPAAAFYLFNQTFQTNLSEQRVTLIKATFHLNQGTKLHYIQITHLSS